MAGRVSLPDRLQRIIISLCLMALTVWGLIDATNWTLWVALALQTELLLTGLAGWCPIYWACRVRSTRIAEDE